MSAPARAEGSDTLAGDSAFTFRSSKLFSVLAVVVAYLLIEAALWSYGPVQKALGWIDASWIVACTLLQRRSARELGLRGEGFRRSIWFPLIALAVAAIWFGIARATGSVTIPLRTLHFWRADSYALWAFEQEFILQSFLFLNLEQLLGMRRAIAGSTLLFAAAHFPNPLLMVCTLFGGLMFTSVFARYRNLWTVGIVHALLGLTIAFTAPDNINHHMRVGRGYWRYHVAPPRAAIVPSGPRVADSRQR
jgi:membrane protease YdiL (CAAX protease family)